ncbi:MAG: sulfate reduction electron transfer complex DsrMKJOP subunit DsrM [Candidatus Methylomirabilales bacterium]
MTALAALGLVAALGGLAFLGGLLVPLRPLFGLWVPWAAALTLLAGLSITVLRWARSPVPFRIPTTCGQQRSLPWIRAARLENPSSTLGAVGRMALEIGLFRSLFRNARGRVAEGGRLVLNEEKWLWLAALGFHWALLVILVRHLRFFLEPVPALVSGLAALDGFFQVGAPVFYASDAVVAGALLFLFARRLWTRQVRHVSLFADYFVLVLLLAIVGSGLLMRYVVRIDTVAAKQLALGLATLTPAVPGGVNPLVFLHLGLVSLLAAFFPFSKLVHMAGAFLSPTRNLANTNRARRHVNPWNAPVPVHTYEEWEAEFTDKLQAAGLPLDKI